MSENDKAPTMADRVAELRRRQDRAREMGGDEGLRRHRASGRLPVRERVELLVDDGSWFEIGALALPEMRSARHVPGDAAVTGFGTLDGRRIAVVGIDSSVLAGTTAPTGMRKQGRLIDLAQRKGMPIVLLCDADGGRIPDVMGWRFSHLPLDFKTFLKRTDGGPTVPRAAAVLGPSYGDSALHASTADFVVMADFASLALVGPSVIEPATGEKLTDRELGGPDRVLAIGNAHMVVPSEAAAMDAIAAFLSFLPANSAEPAPVVPPAEPAVPADRIEAIVPLGAKAGYDMRELIRAIADADSIFPWAEHWGPSLLTCFARLGGDPVGIVANQPIALAGALDAAALTKEHDFVAMCDTFNLPLIFLHDVPGLMVGAEAERAGTLKAYERLALRIATAEVPKIGVVIRKAFGGGHFAMGGRPTHPDFLFAWPTAEMGFMAPDTGIRTVHRRQLEAALQDGGQAAHDRLLAELQGEWDAEAEPWEAAAHLALDDVIEPARTRAILLEALAIAWGSGPRVR
ncbi:acyl-CoA carboxylase subunit beta [Parablastomonas sp. CN1-191]|uniref:acyl-CoA carboxylase subunit beta n=1 Tax=Parablastomonas sp. CN1-191 TaxID=3400908 RepID=UPI003BF90B49